MVSETKATKGSARSMQYQANDKGFAVEVGRNGLMGDDPKDHHRQMRAIENQYSRANFENKRITQVISLTKEEAKEMKSGKDWEDLALKHYEKKGIDLKNHAYIMHTHGSTKNPHLHITVSRVSFEGKMAIKDNRIGEDFGKISDKIAKERGWSTAKEIGEMKRHEVGRNINEVLQKEKVADFENFKSAMGERGYHVKLAQSEAKGTYGMRIIPKDEFTETPSPRLAKSGQGYKLSEIEKAGGSKAKFNIEDIKKEIQNNKLLSEKSQYNRFDQIQSDKSEAEKWEIADKNINMEVEKFVKSNGKERVNFGSDIDPILRKEIGKEFKEENVWAVIDKHGGDRYQDKLNTKIENLQKIELENSLKTNRFEAKQEQNQEPRKEINRFDQAEINREAKREQSQEQEQERPRRRGR